MGVLQAHTGAIGCIVLSIISVTFQWGLGRAYSQWYIPVEEGRAWYEGISHPQRG